MNQLPELGDIFSTEAVLPFEESDDLDFSSYDILKEKVNVIEEIEKLVLSENIDYLTATLEVVKKLDWEPEWIAKYLDSTIKEKIRLEAENNGLIKRQSRPAILFE